jgi:hypothetical protein
LLLPLIIIGGLIRNKVIGSSVDGEPSLSQAESLLLSDIMQNYKIIMSFGSSNIDWVVDRYHGLLETPRRESTHKAMIVSAALGYSMFIRFVYAALVFYIGGVLAQSHGLDMKEILRAICVLISTALGTASAI